eukprot:TRINITY_DN3176_c0_g2_i1.p2 TRINITY_DN3176_c0_g2~~TRINITY_DN3176_c0_g2_i1.p2  ORF type:complete len:158 (+),score=37.93 TRINITY_DN3176_c0_g2_i1:68-541(+)
MKEVDVEEQQEEEHEKLMAPNTQKIVQHYYNYGNFFTGTVFAQGASFALAAGSPQQPKNKEFPQHLKNYSFQDFMEFSFFTTFGKYCASSDDVEFLVNVGEFLLLYCSLAPALPATAIKTLLSEIKECLYCFLEMSWQPSVFCEEEKWVGVCRRWKK